jgi:hypothetical protein
MGMYGTSEEAAREENFTSGHDMDLHYFYIG